MKKIVFLFLSSAALAFGGTPFNTVRPKASSLYSVEVVADFDENDTNISKNDTVPYANFENSPEVAQVDSLTSSMEWDLFRAYRSVSLPLKKIFVTSHFGKRRDPFSDKQSIHYGLDLRADSSEVYAMFNGTVKKVGRDKRSGLYVVLEHGDYTISYCHLSLVTVKKHEYVEAGGIVALSGNSGRSTGPHLHITAKYKGRTIDPLLVLDYIVSYKSNIVNQVAAMLSKKQ